MLPRVDGRVFVFGAGATWDCGGPLTRDLLPDAFKGARTKLPRKLAALDAFLQDIYRLKPRTKARSEDDYPQLPSLVTLIDTAMQRRKNVTPTWTLDRLPEVRAGIEYAIFLSLQTRLRRVVNHYFGLFMGLRPDPDGPTVISLNYDTLADRALFELGAWAGSGDGVPEFGCRFLNLPTPRRPFGRIFKLHGSVNWLRCRRCDGIQILGSQRWDIHGESLPPEFLKTDVTEAFRRRHLACIRGHGPASAFVVAPSHRKDYESRELDQIWARAEDALRKARHVYFVGYSLPDDDTEISLLLIRSLRHLDSRNITVVEKGTEGVRLREHPAGQRYAKLFGDVNWYPNGFASWVKEQIAEGGPLRKPLEPAVPATRSGKRRASLSRA